MKRIFSLILALIMLVVLGGCTFGNSEQREAIDILTDAPSDGYAMSDGTTLESQVLYEDGEIKVVAAGITGEAEEPIVVLAVENGSRWRLGMDAYSIVVDGWAVDGWCDMYELDKRSVGLAYLSTEYLEDLERFGGVTPVVGSVDCLLRLYDCDEYDTIVDINCHLETSASEKIDTSVPEGLVLYEQEGVSVKMIELGTNYYGRSEVVLLVENNTDKAAEIEVSHFAVNGWNTELWICSTVPAGAHGLCWDHLYDEDYNDLNLWENDEVTFTLDVYEGDRDRTLGREHVSITLAQVTLSTAPADFN